MLPSLRNATRRTVTEAIPRGSYRFASPAVKAQPLPPPPLLPWGHIRASSSASSRWKARQGRDVYAREAKVQGLKSRAAFKLLEIDAKHRIFRKGQTVVDLGYAPGSWSQVALERTKPNGRILGIDLIPAQPPRGVSTIQGNFLSPKVHDMVKQFLTDFHPAPRPASAQRPPSRRPSGEEASEEEAPEESTEGVIVLAEQPSYIDAERQAAHDVEVQEPIGSPQEETGRMVDVVLSDMMMNTSGNSFRDHAGSMDLCNAALTFASDTLKAGGHFVCKFYQGNEEKLLEANLKKLFTKVYREKPESSRSESREAYFVALRRKGDVTLQSLGQAD